MIDWAVYSAAR